MPVVINILSTRDYVEHNNEELNGMEYKQNLIKSICMLQWFPANVTTLAEMFVYVSDVCFLQIYYSIYHILKTKSLYLNVKITA